MANLDFSNNSNGLQAAANLLNQVVSQYVVRPTGLDNGGGFGGFVFDVTGDEETVLVADITDHYTEQNSAIQDHIALRPVTFTVRGYVAELTDALSQALNLVLASNPLLGLVDDFLPGFTFSSLQAYSSIESTAIQARSTLSEVQSIYQLFTQSNTASTKQQAAYNFFKQNWNTRQLFTIETPYETLTNMAIERVTALQKDDNRYVSDFAVTFKQIRYASVNPIAIQTAGTAPAGPTLNGQPGSNNSVPPPPGGPPGGPYNFNSQNTPIVSGRANGMLVPVENESTFTGQPVDITALAKQASPLIMPPLPIQLPTNILI